MKAKNFALGMCSATLGLSLIWGQSHAKGATLNPTVYLDGAQMQFEVKPIIVEGSTLVPMRKIFESLGAVVNWDSNSHTVYATKNGMELSYQIGTTSAKINNELVQLSVPGQISDGNTLVPLRFISEALGCKVDWISYTSSVMIKSPSTRYNNSQKDESDRDIHIQNLTQIGFAQQYGEWTYFSNMNDSNKIYKISNDGTKKKKLTDQSAKRIVEENGYIYFADENDSKVYRIPSDGSVLPTNITDVPVSFYQVYGEYIYWVDAIQRDYKPSNLNKMKLDGTEKEILSEGVITQFAILNNKIYVENHEDGVTHINEMNLDGTDKKKITNDLSTIGKFQIVGASLFFGYEEVWEMKLDGSKELRKIDLVKPASYFVANEWIYYVKYTGNTSDLYRMRLDGTERTKYQQSRVQLFNIAGDWIYCLIPDPAQRFTFKMVKFKVDGGDSIPVD